MTEWSTAYLSIGSNKGDKKENLAKAIARLDQEADLRVKAVSLFYRTAPQNYTDQDWFVNAALKVETRHNPESLLDLLKVIEQALDSEGKPFRFGPRAIDLDIIYFDNVILKTDRLEIPHPRMHERCFVLRPMCDIGENSVHPILKQTPVELLQQIETLENQEVIPLDQEENHEIFY